MLDGLTLDQMRVLIAVAETGSFRAAAKRLGRVQSAISHAIGNLETELGICLFDRSGHRPTLTVEGQTLLADARAVLLKTDALRARARGMEQGVELELRIVVDTLFPLPEIGAALLAMQNAFPTVSVNLSILPLGGPVSALDQKKCDLAITVGEEFRNPHIEAEAVGTTAMIAVVAATHPLAQAIRGDTLLPKTALAEHLQIVIEDPTPLSDGTDIGVLSPGTWRVGSLDVKHSLILSGLGWGRMPFWRISQDLEDDRLIRVPAASFGKDGETLLHCYLLHRTDQTMGPAARLLRREILARTQSNL